MAKRKLKIDETKKKSELIEGIKKRQRQVKRLQTTRDKKKQNDELFLTSEVRYRLFNVIGCWTKRV